MESHSNRSAWASRAINTAISAETWRHCTGASWGGFSTAAYLSSSGEFPGKIVLQYLAYFLGEPFAPGRLLSMTSPNAYWARLLCRVMSWDSIVPVHCDQQSDQCCGFAGLYFAAGVFLDLFLLGATTFAGINYSTNAEAFQKAVKEVCSTLLPSIAMHR